MQVAHSSNEPEQVPDLVTEAVGTGIQVLQLPQTTLLLSSDARKGHVTLSAPQDKQPADAIKSRPTISQMRHKTVKTPLVGSRNMTMLYVSG